MGIHSIQEMKEIIQEYPQLRIAIGHFGMVTTPHWQEQIKLARHKNVMIESGGSPGCSTVNSIRFTERSKPLKKQQIW